MRYDNKVKEKAFGLYCDGKSTREIAKALDIKDHHTIARWIKEYKWEERAHSVSTKAAQKTDDWRAGIIDKTLNEHYEGANKLRLVIENHITQLGKQAADPLDMERLAKALKTTQALERQALGLKDETEPPGDISVHITVTKYAGD